MSSLSTYTLALTAVSGGRAAFLLTPSGDGQYGFSFLYRKIGAATWNTDASLYAPTAGAIQRNAIFGVSGPLEFWWAFEENDIYDFDAVEARIEPEPVISVVSPGSLTTVTGVADGRGYGGIEFGSSDKFEGLAGIDGGNLTWAGAPVMSGLGAGASLTLGIFDGQTRIFIADPANNRIVETTTAGTVVNTLSIPGTPVHCDYNVKTGDLVYSDSAFGDVVVMGWKDPSTSAETSPWFGTMFFGYFAAFGSFLPGVVSATFGASDSALAIVQPGVLRLVNTDIPTQTSWNTAEFESARPAAAIASMPFDDLAWAWEYGGGNILAVRQGGGQLAFSPSLATHQTYQRSLGPSAATEIHSGLFGDLLRPASPRETIVFSLMNENEIIDADQRMAKLYPDETFLSYVPEGRHRGDILADTPVWGLQGVGLLGHGTQTLAVLTGQRIPLRVEGPESRIGYTKDGASFSPVVVRESLTAVLHDLTLGMTYPLLADIPVASAGTIVVPIPSATPASYAYSLSNGNHGLYILEMTVTERYFCDEASTDEVMPPRTRLSATALSSYWWRQILKEIQTPISPVSSQDFALLDFSETEAVFFDRWT